MTLRQAGPLMIPVLLALACSGIDAQQRARPSPQLTPEQVVRIQLEALQRVDEPTPEAGFAVVFGFASPGNQAQTGPLPKFTQLVRDGYGEMLNHRRATLAPTVLDGDEALQGVELIDKAGVVHRYVFILSKQREAPFAECWMTDGVYAEPDSGESRKPELET